MRSNLLTEDGAITTEVQGSKDLVAEDLWCAVCVDEANKGYQFYNYSAGTTKILGMTGSEAGGRAKMYEKSELADNSDVYTTFYYNQTAFRYDDVVPNAFRVATTGNNYLNSRTQDSKAYLAFWNDANAIKQCSGSAFVFTGLDELASTIQSLVDTWTPYAGKPFGHTQDAINTLSTTKATSYSSIDEFLTSYNQMKNAVSTFNSSSRIMPTVGKKYALKNAHSNNYVHMPISFGSDLTNTNALCRNACWVLEQGSSDGAYRFRNATTNYYISTDNFDPGTSAFDYSFRPSSSVAGATAIGNGDNVNAYKFMHMNPSPAIGWAADAGASQWRFEEISDEAYNALPAIDENTMDFIALKAQLYNAKLPKTTGDDVSAAKTAFTSSKTLDNANAYMAAVENNQYVRIISVNPFKDLQLDNNGAPISNGIPADLTVPTVWHLEFVDPTNNDFRMKIRHMNTGKYLGAVYESVGMSDDFTNGAAFTFTATSDKYYIADGNGAKLCYTSSGSLTNSGNNNLWYMDFAKQVNIPLTTVGTKTYATAYLPFPVSAVTGANAYVGTLNAERNYIDFTDVTSGFAAREGVVLEGDASAETHKAVLTIGGTVEKKENCFTGSCTPVSVAESERDNYRVLGVSTTDESRIAFFKPSAQLTTIGANRAYIFNTNLSSLLNVRYGQIEGIGEVTTSPAAEHSDAPVYDLTGRRVMQTVKGGVYIQNGKKFIVK